MARTVVPVAQVSRFQAVALTPVAGDLVNGMQVQFNNGATYLWASNAAVTDQTADFILVETVDFQPASPLTVTIPAGADSVLVGPLPSNLYGNVLEFDVSSASLSFLAFSLL